MNRNMSADQPAFDAVTGRRLDASWPRAQATLTLPAADEVLARADIRFVAAAEWRCPPGWQIPRRRLPTVNYSFYCAGTAWIDLDERQLAVRAGDFVLLPADCPHRVRQDATDPVHGLSGHCTARGAGGLDIIALLGFPLLIPAVAQLDDTIMRLTRDLAQAAAVRSPAGMPPAMPASDYCSTIWSRRMATFSIPPLALPRQRHVWAPSWK